MDGQRRVLPFASGATIIRASQKDASVVAGIGERVIEIVREVRGGRYVHENGGKIRVLVQALYLLLTTGVGARTLGEEYVDVRYANSTGERRVGAVRGLLYVVLQTLVRCIGERFTTLSSVHLALFYFTGKYHELAKRVLGMRYALGHTGQRAGDGHYTLLGVLLLVQALGAAAKQMAAATSATSTEEKDKETAAGPLGVAAATVDLADMRVLPYIGDGARTCMLCLDAMRDPAAAACGHVFCWQCVLAWTNTAGECPLCRAPLRASQLLPLR